MATKKAKQTIDQVKTFADSLSDDFLYCRRFGHNWHPYTAVKHKWWYEATIHCDRCGCDRIETINRNGEIVKRAMHYPAGYLSQHIGRIAGIHRGYLRIAAIERFVSTIVEPEEA